MLGEEGCQKTSKPWDFSPLFFYLRTRSLFLLKGGSFPLGPNAWLYLVVWGASIISLRLRGASAKLPAVRWNDCFCVINEGIKVGADVGCQVLQRGVARKTLLGDQTTLSTAARCFAARDVNVTHTERAWRVYDWEEPLLQKLTLSALRVFANRDDWNFCIVLH